MTGYIDSSRFNDEIDRVLARHYGFSDEELDFIINYDIKYRMGGADEGKAGDQKLCYPTDRS